MQEHKWIERLIELACAFDAKAQEKDHAQTTTPRQILIVAGGAASMNDKQILDKIEPLLTGALEVFHGTVISGGTISGIPGCVGKVSKALARRKAKHFRLMGYLPERLPLDAPLDKRYDELVKVEGDKRFSPGQVLRTWEDLLEQDHMPADITLLGFGGGPLAAVEYRVALAFGATVAVVQDTDGAAADILDDPIRKSVPTLLALPLDSASARALTTVATVAYQTGKLEKMAQAFHNNCVAGSPGKLPANMRPWEKLPDTYKTANREQARYAIEILRAAGFTVQPVRGKPKTFSDFKKKEIEKMAELEHGRWNVERLRNGWCPGSPRDDAGRIHDCLVPWKNLPESIKRYDRQAVMAYPDVLAKAGLAIAR